MSDDSANPSKPEHQLSIIEPVSLPDGDPRFPGWPTGGGVTKYVYAYECRAPAFEFEHDVADGVFRLRWADGRVEVFRDKPARHLRVEPDETGAMRPVLERGRPVYLYLCREEREVR